MEDPLGGVVGIGFREAVRVLIGGDLFPVFDVEGDFDEGGVGDLQRLIDFAYRGSVLGGGAEAPDGGQAGDVIGDYDCYVLMESVRCVVVRKQHTHPVHGDTGLADSLGAFGGIGSRAHV